MTSQTPYIPTSGYNPAALLAPKSKSSKDTTSPRHDYNVPLTYDANDADDKSNNNPAETPNFGSMIERMHKVEKRQDRPVKRQKVQHEANGEDTEDDLVEVKKKQEFNVVGGSGEMGQYLKEQREELNSDPATIRDEIDLTLEDSDDEENDVVIVKDDLNVEVCLGRIENARVNAHKVPTPKSVGPFQSNAKIWMAMPVSLHRRADSSGINTIISVKDPTGKEFGNIDQRVSIVLAKLMDGARLSKLRLQARLDARPKKPFDYPGQSISDHYAITINLYVQKSFVKGLGRLLSQHQIWLRDPLAVDRNIEICNPHKPAELQSRKGVIPGSRPKISSTMVVRTHEEVRADVLRIFDTLKDTKDLPEMQAPKPVLTQLLSHQKQAMYFLNKRERLPVVVDKGINMVIEDDEDDPATKASKENDKEEAIWQKKLRPDGRPRWVNAITGHEVKAEPQPLLGGILADVMGLGKTLNILSLVVGSLSQAQEWAQREPVVPEDVVEEGVEYHNSKATLLVCPLSTIVNWEEQIRAHLKDKSIKYYIYQGQNRTNNAKKLCKYDLVITTYQSVGHEYSRTYFNRPNKPLFEVDWFRIVLDEAHQIRNTRSGQSNAACSLRGERRWCVTGTPVQNRLEDLGALIKFLKIKPFDEAGAFSRYISTPLRTGNQDAIMQLRILVDSITLRRLKDKLNLPERNEYLVKLRMSESERNLYDQFARDTSMKLDAMTGAKKTLGGKSYAQVLKAIGRLRMICAHGGDMLSDDDWELAKGFDAMNAIDLEDEDDFKPDKTPQQAFEMFRLMKEANVASCSKCNKQIEASQELEELDEGEDETLGFLTPCNQLLCPRCIKSWKKEMEQRVGADNRGECTICENYIRLTTFEIKQRALAEDAEKYANMQATKFAKNIARYTGPHTKTRVLVKDLQVSEEWSRDNSNQLPIKSVVFSEWTSHLDLIQLALSNYKIPFTRLDGSMVFSKRTVALNTFSTSNDVNVILVSLKAGGLGLNLTAASRVYVMEPNYNPAAEQQAIERVHRLGQKRAVDIKRFVMEDSIEERVVKIQQRKLALANFSVNRDESIVKPGSKEKSRQTLEEIRELLR